MGATPTTTNQAAVFLDALVKAGMSGGAAAMKALIAANPDTAFLEGPILHIITDDAIDELGKVLYTNAADLVNKVVIDMQTDVEKSIAASATNKLNNAVASGDQNAIADAQKDFENAMASLIHSDGSANP